MSYITNQWLKGHALRNRGHFPIEISIAAKLASSKSDESHGVSAHLNLKRGSDDHQAIYLTNNDLGKLLPKLNDCSTYEVRKKISCSHAT